jgi:hypothetical protein
MSSPVTTLIDRVAIVLNGSFNPTIFQPAWFAAKNLLREAETSAAEVKIIGPQLCHFQTEWLELQVIRNRFIAQSRNGGYEGPLKDLVASTFGLLEHTPLSNLGMNREVQLQFDNEDRWHRFGHRLVPKDLWNEILDTPGLLNLGVQGLRRNAPPGSNINVFVSSTGPLRADIDINEHRNATAPESAASLMAVLKESWEQALGDSARIAAYLTGLVA